MRVALLIRSLAPGGAERQLVLLARQLRSRGHQVFLLTFYGGGALEADLAGSGVTTVSLGKSGRWDLVAFMWKLRSALRSARPDVLYTYGPVPNVIGVLMRPFVRRVPVVWGVGSAELDWAQYGRVVKLTFWGSALASWGAKVILVNSLAGMRYHQSIGYPSNRMRHVPNGIDTEKFRPDPVGAAAFREEYGLAGTVIGHVGRLDPIKDHETFLRAARCFLDGGQAAEFLIVGDGSGAYQKAIRDQIKQLGLEAAVKCVGHRADLAAVYSAMSIHVLTSRSEGTPNVVAEAMACGVACVVTDVGDAAVMVGNSGRVVSPGDAAGLATAWGELLRADPIARASEARQQVTARFSLERFVNSTECALREACGVF